MITRLVARRSLIPAFALGAVTAGCSFTTSGELDTFAGEWCTLGGLGSDNLPAPGVAYVGATLVLSGNQVLGTGTTSRPGSTTIYPARFRGDITGDSVSIRVSDLEDEPATPGPDFTMTMHGTGPRDMEGTMAGDSDFVGSIHLVRLGPRCFTSS